MSEITRRLDNLIDISNAAFKAGDNTLARQVEDLQQSVAALYIAVKALDARLDAEDRVTD